MAPLSFALATTTTTTTTTTSSSALFSQTLSQKPPLKNYSKQTNRFQVSCNVSSDNNENPPSQKLILPQTPSLDWNVDRRNLLLGLGGVSLTGLPSSAFATPIETPPILSGTCKAAGSGFNPDKGLLRSTACCPPASKVGPEKDYIIPDGPTRIRQPMRNGSDAVKKYQDAIAEMRALPDSDPRSFVSQAKVHCAYCNGSYTQSGQELQIHNSWLFFPFHRWYIYFFERILGSLIKDPTFALPYWNWDNPDGMVIPDLFLNEKLPDSTPNPLFDLYRNANHLGGGAIVDIDYTGKDRVGLTTAFQQEINYTAMNRQMMRNAFDTTSFFGGKYVAGSAPIANGDNVVGSIEAGCHTAVHRWVGNPLSPNGEDMANFYSAGYDPLFYVHHSNVDRTWTLWEEMGGKAPTDPDWKNASYVFYDEFQNPVRVYNRDTVNLNKLKYQYAKTETPWTARPPRSRCKRPGYPERTSNKTFVDIKDVKFPLSLPETVRLRVPRPPACKNRDLAAKAKEKEILCFLGINFDSTATVKFDVFVNDCDEDEITACDSENVGSFAAIPAKGMSMKCKSGMRFALTELLEETKNEGDDSIRVTIVPRTAGKDVSVDEIEIRLIPVV